MKFKLGQYRFYREFAIDAGCGESVVHYGFPNGDEQCRYESFMELAMPQCLFRLLVTGHWKFCRMPLWLSMRVPHGLFITAADRLNQDLLQFVHGAAEQVGDAPTLSVS